VAETLRHDHRFGGYIHLKTIPDADAALLARAGAVADRLSINVELPQEASLARLAPQKNPARIRRAMGGIRLKIEEAKDARRQSRKASRFSTGQSTQMIIGADSADDLAILGSARTLYGNYKLSRVYYSAFSPIPDASRILPLTRPPLMREHRLYQADWLLRFYGFEVEEIADGSRGGMLDLEVDPKLAWALQHREWFPVDVNTAVREVLLRVPGFGTKSVKQMLSSRRWRRLRLEDIARLCRGAKTSMPFIVTEDWRPGGTLDRLDLRARLAPPALQGELFA
jgi:predicted DNA-binding helix-hairpin-helix protein